MARKDIRSDGRAIPLTHHSARGKVHRNAGNFTRGSQLLTHEMLMWFSGAKMPVVVWFFAFAAAWFVIMGLKLDEHGFLMAPYKIVKDGRVTDEMVFLRADEETDKNLAPADIPIDERGRAVRAVKEERRRAGAHAA